MKEEIMKKNFRILAVAILAMACSLSSCDPESHNTVDNIDVFAPNEAFYGTWHLKTVKDETQVFTFDKSGYGTAKYASSDTAYTHYLYYFKTSPEAIYYAYLDTVYKSDGKMLRVDKRKYKFENIINMAMKAWDWQFDADYGMLIGSLEK